MKSLLMLGKVGLKRRSRNDPVAPNKTPEPEVGSNENAPKLLGTIYLLLMEKLINETVLP